MGITKSGKQKDKLDRFYTNSKVAEECLDFLKRYINFNNFDFIIEPSAGNGSFSNQIDGCLSFDISPQDNNIVEQDFLKMDLNEYKNKNVLIIGNPPFGQQASKAFSFIEKSSEIASIIAFILPLSFKKQSYQNKMPSYFHLLGEKILKKNSFLYYGEQYDLPCVFQIWEKRKEKRLKYKQKSNCSYFAFVDRDNADFRIQRVGGKAGIAYKDLNGAKTSNYFIKNLSEYPTDKLIEIINSLEYKEVNWTCGPKSLSKNDLITNFENMIGSVN